MNIRCKACFEEYDSEFGLCPNCGYYEGKEPDEIFELPVGTVLANRYVLGKAVGCGGFGITYKAWDKRLDTPVAIKEFFPNGRVSRTLDSPNVITLSAKLKKEFDYGLERFLDEAQNMSKFSSHSNIVNVYEFFEENNTAYIVMEFLDGVNLSDYMKSKKGDNGEIKKIDVDESVNIILNVCNALKDIHKEGIIHRDISPDNIFICKNHTIKLIDFGAARFSKNEEKAKYSIILKPGFAPIEQYEQISAQGPWTDIYALGATMYYMITGVKPDESTNRSRSKDDLANPIDIDSSIPEYISLSIMKAMAIDSHMRFKSIEDFEKAIVGEKKVISLKAERGRKKRKRIISATICVAVFAFIVGMFSLQMGEESLKSAQIDLWYMQIEGVDCDASYASIIDDFSKAYSNVKINAVGIPQDEYEDRLAKAIASGKAPDVFQSTDLPDSVLKNTTDMSTVVYPKSDKWYSKATAFIYKKTVNGCKLLSDYDKYYKTPNRVPVSFNVPVIYVNTALVDINDTTSIKNLEFIEQTKTDASVKLLVNSNIKDSIAEIFTEEALTKADASYGTIKDFEKGETAFFISNTADYYDVRSLGTYTVIEIDRNDVVCDFHDTWSISKSDENSQKASERFIQFLLSYNAQNQLYGNGNKIKALPVNKDALDNFGDTFKRIGFVSENTADYIFEEEK